MGEKTLGQIGYEAYAESTGGKTFDGRDMPTWEQVVASGTKVAGAWAAVGIRLFGEAFQRWASSRPGYNDDEEKLRVQLAGCGVAAMGGIAPRCEEAKPGDYGWSASYGDVIALRKRYEKVVAALQHVCRVMPADSTLVVGCKAALEE